jgi:hypothetical protein
LVPLWIAVAMVWIVTITFEPIPAASSVAER